MLRNDNQDDDDDLLLIHTDEDEDVHLHRAEQKPLGAIVICHMNLSHSESHLNLFLQMVNFEMD